MSSEAEVIVRVRHLAKSYQLYDNQHQWLKQTLLGSFKTYYKAFWALKDISFDVASRREPGHFSDATAAASQPLLQILCGITRPTKGDLWVKGRVAPILALGATFDLEATGAENVLIGGAVLGLKRAEVLGKLASIADFAGIGEFMDQPMKLYSTGHARCALRLPSAPTSTPTS